MSSNSELPIQSPDGQLPNDSVIVEATNGAPPEYITFGFGYNQASNKATVVEELGDEHSVIEPLEDPEGVHDKTFIIALGGMRQQVGIREARRFMGHSANKGKEISSISTFQEGRADQLIDKLEGYQHGGPANVIGMSADALSVGRVLVRRPDLIGSAILAFPAGFNTKPPTFAAAAGLARAAFKDKQKELFGGKGLSELGKLRTETRERRAKMVGGSIIPLTVAASYQAADLSKLRQSEDAPGLSIVIGAEDPMTPANATLDGLLSPSDVDYVLVTAGGHGIKSNPGTLEKMRELFPMMEKLKNDRKAGMAMPPLTERMLFLDDVPQTRRDELMKIAANVDQRVGLPTVE